MMEGMYLGFDFGLKRLGVAVGQKITGTARPLMILSMANGVPIWAEVENLFKAWQPVAVIVGMPPDHGRAKHEAWQGEGVRAEWGVGSGECGMQKALNVFSLELHKRFLKPVYLWDEHLSTREAHSQIAENAFPTRKQMNPVDDISAQLILESWLKCRSDSRL
ncbi:MAG: Holliday junction resolvase RuvX [Gammaproteobacteria bacterium]|nr:Holliday junction resolvase RuvX [Gammaproteobacteria bacterium]